MARSLRAEMPIVAEFIDQLRDVFGADSINQAIKAGMDGQQTFWARENGQEVGTRATQASKPRQRASCATCAHWSSMAAPVGYCGAGRGDLEPAYGEGHPLRRLPQNKGADCAHYEEQ